MKFIHNILLAGTLLASSGSVFAADEASYSKLTGTYVGTYRFEMNTTDPGAFGDGASGPGGAGLNFEEKVSDKGVKYKTLGFSYIDGLWKWDFDNMKVTWGGTKLFALELVRAKFQPYNINMEDKKGGLNMNTGKFGETYPHVASSDEITMDIVDNEDGTYSVEFGKKIHLIMAMYPFEKTKTKFKITLENEKLNIVTIDSENDGKELDGVPGARIPKTPTGFPFEVQPSYFSVDMKKDTGVDTNNDGITDIEAEFLGLTTDDMDEDGKSNAEEINVVYAPQDTDEDGFPDYLEAGEDAQKAYTIAKISSDVGSSFKLECLDELPLNGAHSYFRDYNPSLETRSLKTIVSQKGDIPSKINSKGNEIRYKELSLALSQELWLNGLQAAQYPRYRLTFEDKVPEDFAIYIRDIKSGSVDEKGMLPIVHEYIKTSYNSVSDKVVEFQLKDESRPKLYAGVLHHFVFAMGDRPIAYFIDSTIQGLQYKNNEVEGKTGSDGSFAYSSGEVEFSVGNISIGKLKNINKDRKIFIQDIVGVDRIDIEDEKVLKIAQFLYSIDSNSETPQVEISDTTLEAFENVVQSDILSDDFKVEEALTTANFEVKSLDDVKDKLMKTLYEQNLARQAVFIDSNVIGMQFVNNGRESKTRANGDFDYTGDEVEFFIGDISIGKVKTVNKDGKIFIQDVVGVDRTNIEDEKVLKIAQFLQSLDSDTSTNEIEISEELFEKFQSEDDTKIDILSDSFDVTQALSEVGVTARSMDEVKKHLRKSLVDNGIIKDSTDDTTDSNDNSSSGGGSGGSFSWVFLLGLLGLTFFRRKK